MKAYIKYNIYSIICASTLCFKGLRNLITLTVEQRKWVEEFYKKLENKLDWVASEVQDIIPYTTDGNGKYFDKRFDKYSSGVQWWTNGFYAGMLWLLYKHTGKDVYKTVAKKQESMLDEAFALYDELNHDVGFMWGLASKPSYLFDNDKASRVRTLMAANILGARANIKGKYIRAWNHHDYTIIDCLMNVPLLYWASHEVKDDRYKHIAMMHVDSAIKHHVREDGSVVHIVSHNPLKDEVIETLAGQGYAVGSSWTRGQAWAVYGFILNYIHTGEQRYLDTAIKVTDYFIDEAKKHNYKVPIDFRQPTESNYLDNSATVCAACGMIELYKVTCNEKYRDEAILLLQHLEGDCDFSKENHSVVQKCSEAYSYGQHIPLIYADFFLVEAILKLRGSDFLIW